ncbi:hypothetical protein [Nocardia sp. NPDC005978]|uniref:hypothetical protein n=1 Tax=unclassified Nocardia TaxID=2637762 RepID=UPI0033B62C0E
MGALATFLTRALLEFRWLGTIILAFIAGGVLIADAAKSRLSPGKMLLTVGSGLLAVVLFWTLPSLINYVRSDSGNIVPNQPIGNYRR